MSLLIQEDTIIAVILVTIQTITTPDGAVITGMAVAGTLGGMAAAGMAAAGMAAVGMAAVTGVNRSQLA